MNIVALLSVAALVVYVVGPHVAFRLLGLPRPTRLAWLPWLAFAAFAGAWFLPNASLSAGSQTFLLHAVGGGGSAAILSYYLAENAGLRGLVARTALVLAVVCVLGTATEVAELAYDRIVGTRLAADAASDLVANLIGAGAVTALLESVRFVIGERT